MVHPDLLAEAKGAGMLTLYNLLKFVHVVAVIVWLGGLVTVAALHAWAASRPRPAVRACLVEAGAFVGGVVVGPAAAVTLLAGVALVATSTVSFASLWVLWGLAALLASMALGGTVIRRAAAELAAATGTPGTDPRRTAALQQRLRVLSVLNLLLLFSAVAAMVFKPTL